MSGVWLRCRQSGVTLIELIIGLAILAGLVSMAAPGFQSAVQNAQVRTAAESIISGLQLARAEAVRRNRQVRLTLTNRSNGSTLAGGMDWELFADDLSGVQPSFTIPIQSRNGIDGSPVARIGLRTTHNFTQPAAAGNQMPAGITFDGMGRLTSGTTTRQIDITHGSVASARRLSIVLQPGGSFRLCDPVLTAAGSLQGCT